MLHRSEEYIIITPEANKVKRGKRIKIIIISAVCLCAAGLLAYGFISGNLSKGNLPEYSVSAAKERNSMLKGKTVIFLGSSVTYGSASGGNSFVEFLEKCDGIVPVKEAVSGTTLIDNGEKSYVARMKTLPKDIRADAFVCQLSTNDASQKLPLGVVSHGKELGDFDTSTVAGAIEYIIVYARETWNCPVIFYTGTKYDSPEYAAMVKRLGELREKWDIEIIDLWNDGEMNSVSPEDYELYMANPIHPTLAGYGKWWLPKFEEKLEEVLNEK